NKVEIESKKNTGFLHKKYQGSIFELI
ncbi:hypothetical protein, partial [Listeria monocytogenes]